MGRLGEIQTMLKWLFDAEGYIPRSQQPGWTPTMMWVYVVADLVIFITFLLIGAGLLFYATRKKDFIFRKIFVLFSIGCVIAGSSYLAGALEFWYSVYHLRAITIVLTAAMSIFTFLNLSALLPKAVMLPTWTELDKQNKLLRDMHDRRMTVNNSVAEAIVTANSAGNIVEWNRGAEKIFGFSSEEAVGNPLTIIIPPEFRECHLAGIKRLSAGGKPKLFGRVIEMEGLNKQGHKFPVELSITSCPSQDGLLYIGVVRDITHRKANEKQIRVLNEALYTRVDALEAFQYSISHDLHAPLRAMEGFVEILCEDYSDKLDDTGKDCVKRIRQATQRMRNLISDMIRLSSVTQNLDLKLGQVNMSELAEGIIENFRAIDPQRKVEVNIQPNLNVIGDENLLEIALTNMFSNAWKFTNKKELAKIWFGTTIYQGKQVYYIRDNGAGFDMSKVDKLFKPFSRLHDRKDFEGNGIGLTIVKRVITLHDGNIWAEGIVGDGATFYFTIGKKNG